MRVHVCKPALPACQYQWALACMFPVTGQSLSSGFCHSTEYSINVVTSTRWLQGQETIYGCHRYIASHKYPATVLIFLPLPTQHFSLSAFISICLSASISMYVDIQLQILQTCIYVYAWRCVCVCDRERGREKERRFLTIAFEVYFYCMNNNRNFLSL